MNIYGITHNGTHIDVSNTERGAKNYATRHGYDTVSIRHNLGYIAKEIFKKDKQGKWVAINGMTTYKSKTISK